MLFIRPKRMRELNQLKENTLPKHQRTDVHLKHLFIGAEVKLSFKSPYISFSQIKLSDSKQNLYWFC